MAALRAEQRPAAQAGTAVAIDFIATGANGQPVADLQPADVSIKIAGKARTIQSLEFMKSDSGAATASALPPPFAVNGGKPGRSLLIVIDNESLKLGNEKQVRESLDVVLNGLGPADRVAFSVSPKDNVRLGFGAGLPAVKAALASFTGLKSASVTDSETACRSRDSLGVLRTLIDSLAGSETPTSVLFIASSLTLPGTVNRNTSASMQCEVQMEHYQTISSSVASGRVNLYVAQGDDTFTGRDNGLENLAGVGSAGAVMRAQGNGLARVLSESAGYYVATLAPEQGDRPGAVQKMELKVSREGVSTRARSDVALIGKGAGARAMGRTATPKEMVASMSPFNDLPLRVTAVASRGQAGKMTILSLTETVDPSAKITAMTAALFPVGGNKAVFATSAEERQMAGRPVALGLAADPGRYRLRVAATDANGRSGAVDYELNADFTSAGPLKLGDILLVGPRGESFSPQLVFTDEAEIGLQVELFGDVSSVKLGAKIEIAATADGKALAEGQVGGAGTNEPDKFVLSGKIPIAKLAPGDYVVRVVVQAEGHPEGRVTRTLRKVAK